MLNNIKLISIAQPRITLIINSFTFKSFPYTHQSLKCWEAPYLKMWLVTLRWNNRHLFPLKVHSLLRRAGGERETRLRMADKSWCTHTTACRSWACYSIFSNNIYQPSCANCFIYFDNMTFEHVHYNIYFHI